MRIHSVRIKNYKSITDSGFWTLASDITVLAGKNESGKTAILEALRDFDPAVERLPDGALPLHDTAEPSVVVSLIPSPDELELLLSQCNATMPSRQMDQIYERGIIVSKKRDGEYSLETAFTEVLDSKVLDASRKKAGEWLGVISEIVKRLTASNISLPPLLQANSLALQDVEASIAALHAVMDSAEFEDEADQQTMESSLEKVESEFKDASVNLPSQAFLDQLLEMLPSVVYFADFSDVLPFEIPLLEAKKRRPIMDFAKLAEIDIDQVIATKDPQRRLNLLRKKSAAITGDFAGYWAQESIALSALTDADTLRIGVQEEGSTVLFKAEQRSKGFQWFCSFFLRLRAESAVSVIILIDEPGLYLHARAQKDVLRVLEKIAQDSQVVFSTHSPYLIDASRLDRIRLVTKGSGGTTVQNKLHSASDSDSLTPITTAIGLDMANGFSPVKKKNVVLEGPSDWFYIQGMAKVLGRPVPSDYALIASQGADKVPFVVSLLLGWGLDFVVLLDNDNKGRKVAKELSQERGVEETRIHYVNPERESTIEDLFSPKDFEKHIAVGQPKPKAGVSISRWIRDQSLNKVILSKTFFDLAQKNGQGLAVTDSATKAFTRLFDRIFS